MRNSAEGWQSALSKFALDRRDGDQLGTSVVMLVLDKSQSEQTVTDAVLNAKGVELLRCPPNTLAVVHANGFAEYKDDSVQNRTEDDYRQEGRKLPGPRQPVQSYSLSNNGSIVAPKEGCAKHTPRHGGMSNKFPVVFIYFGLLKRDQLWQTCASLLPDLALVLANTSPTAESSHPKHCVKWIPKVETDVSIFSLHYRLRAAQPELKCFSNYKQEVYAEWPKGPSAARRLSAGYVPSSASKFVLSLGANSIKEARTVLVRVATMGMTLCRDMESVGLQQLRRNFGRIGLASFDTNDGSHVEGRHDKQYSCDNNACPRATFSRFFVPNVQEATVPNVKRAIQQKLCFTCAAKAAAAWPCTASEQDLSSKASGSAANAKGPLTRTRSGTSPTKPSALSSAGQTSKAFKTRAIADAAWSLWNSLNTERSVRVVGKAMVPFIRVDGNENKRSIRRTVIGRARGGRSIVQVGSTWSSPTEEDGVPKIYTLSTVASGTLASIGMVTMVPTAREAEDAQDMQENSNSGPDLGDVQSSSSNGAKVRSSRNTGRDAPVVIGVNLLVDLSDMSHPAQVGEVWKSPYLGRFAYGIAKIENAGADRTEPSWFERMCTMVLVLPSGRNFERSASGVGSKPVETKRAGDEARLLIQSWRGAHDVTSGRKWWCHKRTGEELSVCPPEEYADSMMQVPMHQLRAKWHRLPGAKEWSYVGPAPQMRVNRGIIVRPDQMSAPGVPGGDQASDPRLLNARRTKRRNIPQTSSLNGMLREARQRAEQEAAHRHKLNPTRRDAGPDACHLQPTVVQQAGPPIACSLLRMPVQQSLPNASAVGQEALNKPDVDKSSESTSCQSTDSADDECVQIQRGPTSWRSSSENVEADVWNALEELQNPGATASEVYMPLLHAAHVDVANRRYQPEIEELRGIFGAKWTDWVDQLGFASISAEDSNLLRNNAHVDGEVQLRLLEAGGHSLSEEIALAIHAVLNARKARGSQSSNADRGAFGQQDAASCSDARVRGSLANVANLHVQDASAPEEDGAPPAPLPDGAEDALSSDLQSDGDQSVASPDLALSPPYLARSERPTAERNSDMENDADDECNAADPQCKVVDNGKLAMSSRSDANQPVFPTVQIPEGMNQAGVRAKPEGIPVVDVHPQVTAGAGLQLHSACENRGEGGAIQEDAMDARVPILESLPHVSGDLGNVHQSRAERMPTVDLLPPMMPMQSKAAQIRSEKPTQGDSCISKVGAAAAEAEVQVGESPDSDTIHGAASTVLDGGRLDKSVEGSAESHSNVASSDDEEDEYRKRSWRPHSHAPVKLSAQIPQEFAFNVAPDRQEVHARIKVGALPCAPPAATGDVDTTPSGGVQTKVLVNAQAANDVGNPPASNTTLGATNSVLGGGRLDNSVVGRAELHSNDAPPVDDASSGTSSDEDGDGRRPWQRRSHALTEPRDQVQNAPGVAVPTDRQDLHARTGVDVVPCAPIVEIGGAGQRGSFSADPWCPTSTGKRRRLAGVDHGKSCTDLVLPGNGGFDVPSNSFEDANRQGQKRSRADKSMVSDAGGAMRSVVHAAANTEGFVSNANAKEPGSVERQGNAGRGKPTVHQRLGGHGGGRGKNVRNGIGDNRFAGVTEKSEGSPRPKESKDMDGDHHESNRSNPKKAGGGSRSARNNSRAKRAKKLKEASKRIVTAAQDGRNADLSAKPAAVLMAQIEFDARGVNVGDQVLHRRLDGADQSNRVVGSVTTFRQSTIALSGGSDLSPLRIIQRTALADAMRRSALLAMVTARAESSGLRSNLAETQNSLSNLPNTVVEPTPDE
jgi:hypothetical protein